jgi:hypothetical protein
LEDQNQENNHWKKISKEKRFKVIELDEIDNGNATKLINDPINIRKLFDKKDDSNQDEIRKLFDKKDDLDQDEISEIIKKNNNKKY